MAPARLIAVHLVVRGWYRVDGPQPHLSLLARVEPNRPTRLAPQPVGDERPVRLRDDELHVRVALAQWQQRLRGEATAVSDFGYAVPLTEVMLLGLVSLRAGQRTIHYDPDTVRITNLPEANQYLRRPNSRVPWTLGVEEVATR